MTFPLETDCWQAGSPQSGLPKTCQISGWSGFTIITVISFLAVIHMIVTGGLATESQIFFEDERKLQPEGEDSPTCKVTEVSVCVTWPVRKVHHDLLEQCVPIVRGNMARHQFVFWRKRDLISTKSATDLWRG